MREECVWVGGLLCVFVFVFCVYVFVWVPLFFDCRSSAGKVKHSEGE